MSGAETDRLVDELAAQVMGELRAAPMPYTEGARKPDPHAFQLSWVTGQAEIVAAKLNQISAHMQALARPIHPQTAAMVRMLIERDARTVTELANKLERIGADAQAAYVKEIE